MASDLKLLGDLDFIAFVRRLGPAANSSQAASGFETGIALWRNM
jgi:hypothetical protein